MTDANVRAELGEIQRAIQLFLEPAQITELRALEVSTPDYRRPHTVSGYFDDPDALARAAEGLARSAKGIYLVPNPVNPVLLARAVNRVRPASERDALTSDADVVARRWLPIDADPRRPSGISASDAEHEAALARVRLI